MKLRHRAICALAPILLAAAPTAAGAVGLLDLPGLTAVRAYEATFTLTDGTGTWTPGDARLVTRLDPLTALNRDFGAFPGDESYDIFVSTADGTLNPDGGHLTIEGNCFANLGCFNINAVSLFFGTTEVFADFFTRVQYGRPGSFVPGTEANVVDVGPNNLNTFSRFGDTVGMPDARMAITVGFTGLSQDPVVAAIPEPQAWALMILGFAGVGALMRRRRTMAALAR